MPSQQVNRLLETGHITGVAHTVIDAKDRSFSRVARRPPQRRPGQRRGLLVTGHDMTEHRRLEEQLLSRRRWNHRLLAGGVAYFNNLLTAITGHAQFALMGCRSGPFRDDLQQCFAADGPRASPGSCWPSPVARSSNPGQWT